MHLFTYKGASYERVRAILLSPMFFRSTSRKSKGTSIASVSSKPGGARHSTTSTSTQPLNIKVASKIPEVLEEDIELARHAAKATDGEEVSPQRDSMKRKSSCVYHQVEGLRISTP